MRTAPCQGREWDAPIGAVLERVGNLSLGFELAMALPVAVVQADIMKGEIVAEVVQRDRRARAFIACEFLRINLQVVAIRRRAC